MTAAPPIVDALAPLATTETQRVAAQLAQDVFGEVFRQACAPAPAQLGQALGEQETRCIQWCAAGEGAEGQLLRLAMLIAGLDQWGVVYTHTFGLTAIPALSALLGALRSRLDARSDAHFQQLFELLQEGETNAIDFKIELRRSIHLALWHATVACESQAEAQGILEPLGSLLLALDQQMPTVGWRLVADALAHIQICLLDDESPVARESGRLLFESLRHSLPLERYKEILRHSSHVVIAWQQARRANTVQ